jgi:hypothetical protein
MGGIGIGLRLHFVQEERASYAKSIAAAKNFVAETQAELRGPQSTVR